MSQENIKDPALNPIHPGEILVEDFLRPLGISQYRLAKDIDIVRLNAEESIMKTIRPARPLAKAA